MRYKYNEDQKIACLICGRRFTRPASHVWQVHKLSARAYKKSQGLDVKAGIVPDQYIKIMRERLTASALKNLQNGARFRFCKGVSNNYKRSDQTIERLRAQGRAMRHDGRMPSVDKIKISCANCGKQKMIYPRYLKKNNNFCGIVCRNIANNKGRNK